MPITSARPLYRAITAALGWLVMMTSGAAADARVDFATEVLPLLSDRCSVCHGPDEASRQAELRVDVPAIVGAASMNGGLERIIAPGDAEASELIRRITSDDESERMPPADSNLSLSPEEIDTLRRWIDQGATWEQHWSLRPVERPPVPEPSPPPSSTADSHARNPIDRFINARLAAEGLTPTGPDDPYALIRRVTLDLTGLPPTEQEIEAFVNDPSPLAYERLIDRLLASPAYGGRMAVPWLDAARYADTYGYQADVYREVWPWRDWVTDAFRQNMPYDQFITWQLAGDLIPNATHESRLATAFNRLHRQTNEGGSIEEEFRTEYVSDRVNTLGTAILGLTLECARCHDHKYDPISHRNYYELSAFFANIDESGLYSHFTDYVPTPVLDLPSESQQAELSAASAAVGAAEDAYRAALDAAMRPAPGADPMPIPADVILAGERARYEFGAAGGSVDVINGVTDGAAAKLVGAPAVIEGKSGNGIELDGENGFTTPVGGQWDWYQPFTIAAWLRPARAHERAVLWHRSRAWTDAASCGYELLIEDGRLSAALIHFWPGDAVRVRTKDPIAVDRWTHVSVVSDGSGTAAGLKIFVDGEAAPLEIVRDNLVRTIRGGGVDEFAVGHRFRDRGFVGGRIDDLRIFDRDLSPYELSVLAHPADAKQSAPPREALARAGAPEVIEAGARLLEARRRMAAARDAIPAIMTMQEQPGLHATHVLRRGQYDQPGELVTPAVPEALGPMPEDFPRNRLGLARWLTDSRPGHRHPLVSRVAVNRLWQMLFDQGLVATPEDFGLQGEPPSHPRLLDYLAATLVDEGWDIKRMIRRIVTSDAYRRSSNGAPAVREADPENRLLARGPSSRLPIETIRDAALAAGGLLDRTIGGPPVRPYQPEGLWEEKSGASYTRQPGAPSHRRSLYTIWKRTSPPPAMVIFDAPGREVCAAGRTPTETPLQALVLLNDEQYVEAARGTAFSVLRDAADDSQTLAAHLFFHLLGRPGTPAEIEVVVELYQTQLARFEKDHEAAQQYLAVGDFDCSANLGTDSIAASDLAAWTVVAQTLMNLDEWVSR